MSGWFDEQLRARIEADNEAFSDAFIDVSQPLTGKGVTRGASNALEEIARFYGVRLDSHDDILKSNLLMHRTVKLKEDWYKDASGVYLATTKNGNYAALIPGLKGYSYKDYASGKTIRLNSETQKNLDLEAECFYRPLPARKLSVRDLFSFIITNYSAYDLAYFALVTLLVTLVAMIPPYMTRKIYADVIRAGSISPLFAAVVFMITAGLADVILQAVRGLALSRMEVKTDVAVNAAVMMRLINLPVEFFKQYTSGNLAQRAACVNMLCTFGMNVIFSAGLSAVMSLVYLWQIFEFTPHLVVPAMCIMLVMSLLSVSGAIIQSRFMRRSMEVQAGTQGIIFSFINGIQKIKLAGAEKRAFAKWAALYKKQAALDFNPPLFVKLLPVFQPAVTLAGTFVLYLAAFQSGISVSDYMAFMVAYGLLSAAFTALCMLTGPMASIGAITDMIRPILETVPENSSADMSLRLRGGIEVNNLTFRYSPKAPVVLNDISFKVRPGEYVAVVGRSGCGKSTLMRLLLGFEQPQNGVIYYDGNDIKSLNLKALRSNIGCVMQNSKLFPGSIYSNITITAPGLSLEDAWKAAELAGVAEDIRKMPMKMNTMISEGAGTLSGGQVQRIIIARAIASKPKILLFDEATSALDNITQKIVADSLAGLKCTRLIIAHRLSTVKNCSRILVIDGGRVAESGSYEELMKRKGLFASLVERQRLGEEL